MDGSGSGYLKSVCDYVHLNPVRGKLLRPEQPLSDYGWSSYPEYLKGPRKRPGWLRVDRLLGEWAICRDDGPGRRRFKECMEQRKAQENREADPAWKQLRRGWCWGEAAFREELLAMMGEEQAEHHDGEELVESVERQAEQLIGEMMRALGWEDEELGKRRNGDEQKVRMAAKLRGQTTMSWKWIAQKLGMGHWRSAANAVRLHLLG